MNNKFTYPVTDFGEALHVLNPNSDLDIFKDGLYVNLDEVRGTRFIKHICTQLGVKDGKMFSKSAGFVKILLTGHRGSGKSVELRRMMHDLQNVYLPVFINIEEQLIKLSAVEPEDIYQLIIIELMETLQEKGIEFNVKDFTRITDLWFEEKTLDVKNSINYTTSVGAEGEVGINAYLFKLRAFLKSLITSQSEQSDLVRRKIKANISDIIANVNVELLKLQPGLSSRGYSGVLFILDGTEKLNYELARNIFIHDAPIFNQINACFIFASPVFGLYDIHAGQAFFNQQILPMVKVTPQNLSVYKTIVTKRVDENTFFDPGILDCIARKSGGSIRLFLEICYNALLNSNFSRVDKSALKDALYDMGLFLFRRLDNEHKEILRSGTNDFDFGNERVKEMLFSLVLLVQNGTAEINPLMVPFITGSQNYLCD